ncbi:putative transcription factor MYB-HB-like family [Helianthus annuus]|nr:putative transcription factor MYB-HB-like family [Helianthus annuus]
MFLEARMAHEHKCCNKQKVKLGAWSTEEDETLFAYVINHDQVKWSFVPELTGLKRCGKSCRLRWINYLNPNIKRGNFNTEEINLIFSLQKSIGNKWAQIAKHMPGRTANEIKNFWNSKQKKKKWLVSNNQPNEASSSSETIHHISILESFNQHPYPPTHTNNFQLNHGSNMHSLVDCSLNEEPPMNQLYTIPPYAPSSMASNNVPMMLTISHDHGLLNSSVSSIWMTPTSYAQNFPTECHMYTNLITWIDDDQSNSSKPLEDQPYSSQPLEEVEEFDINEFFNFDLFEEDQMKFEASQYNNSHVI